MNERWRAQRFSIYLTEWTSETAEERENDIKKFKTKQKKTTAYSHTRWCNGVEVFIPSQL